MKKITTATGATLEFKEKSDVLQMIEDAEEERERKAAATGKKPDDMQVQHISMDSFDFTTPEQILKHNSTWKEVSEKPQGRRKNASDSEGGSGSGVM